MSVAQVRGGFPHILREAITTTVRKHKTPSQCFWLKIRVSGNPCRLYFTQIDADNDENYVEVPVASASTPYGEWEGPVELGAPSYIWLKGQGGTSNVELVTFQRRG